jgi:hypothetical protein
MKGWICVPEQQKLDLERQQPIKESAITLQALAELFSGDVVAAVPLLLQLRAFLGELLRDALDDSCHQRVSLLDCVTRLVDERRLDLVPASAEVPQLVFRKKRSDRGAIVSPRGSLGR